MPDFIDNALMRRLLSRMNSDNAQPASNVVPPASNVVPPEQVPQSGSSGFFSEDTYPPLRIANRIQRALGTNEQPQQPTAQQPVSPQPGFTPNIDRNSGALTTRSMLQLNPYNQVKPLGIDNTGFNQEAAALKEQGRIMGDAQKAYGESMASNEGERAKSLGMTSGQLASNSAKYTLDSARYKQDLDELQQQHPALTRDDIIGSLSVGRKITGGIAAVLGGISQGMLHSASNPAIDIMNKNIDSAIEANKVNYDRKLKSLESQRALSVQDFQIAQQGVMDQANLNNKIFDANLNRINADYQKASAPAVKEQLAAAAARVMQAKAQANLQADQFNLQMGLKAREWHLSMLNNPNVVTVGTDTGGNPVNVIASSPESAKTLRSEVVRLNAMKSIMKQIDELANTPLSQRNDVSRANSLNNLMTEYANLSGTKASDYANIVNSIESGSREFVKRQTDLINSQLQKTIEVNSIRQGRNQGQ